MTRRRGAPPLTLAMGRLGVPFAPRRRGQAGATAIEFGILAAGFVLIAVALVEFALQLAVAVALEFGARNAAMRCSVGRICDAARVAEAVVDRSVVLDARRLGVRREAFVPAALASEGVACADLQPGERAVLPSRAAELDRVCLLYRQPWLTPLGRLWSDGRGFVDHRAQIVVRREPR